MIYRWYKKQIEEVLQDPTAEITIGGIPTGEYKSVEVAPGVFESVPVKISGVEIRTKAVLDDTKLKQLDSVLTGHIRSTAIIEGVIK